MERLMPSMEMSELSRLLKLKNRKLLVKMPELVEMTARVDMMERSVILREDSPG